MRKIILSTIMLMLTTLMFAACDGHGGNQQVDTFKTRSGREITIHAIKHGSIRMTYGAKEIEVDPVARMKPETDYGKFPKADYILVTHEHGDHCDPVAIRQLEKPSTMIITNENCAKLIGKGTVMRNGDRLKLSDDIAVEAVPAYNTTPGRTKYHPQGRDNGFVLSIDGFRIYISGDTEDIPEMAGVKDVDVAFLSTNQPYTMTTGQCANAAKVIKPKVLFPYHYSDTDVQKVAELLEGSGIDVRIRSYK